MAKPYALKQVIAIEIPNLVEEAGLLLPHFRQHGELTSYNGVGIRALRASKTTSDYEVIKLFQRILAHEFAGELLSIPRTGTIDSGVYASNIAEWMPLLLDPNRELAVYPALQDMADLCMRLPNKGVGIRGEGLELTGLVNTIGGINTTRGFFESLFDPSKRPEADYNVFLGYGYKNTNGELTKNVHFEFGKTKIHWFMPTVLYHEEDEISKTIGESHWQYLLQPSVGVIRIDSSRKLDDIIGLIEAWKKNQKVIDPSKVKFEKPEVVSRFLED